MSLLSHKRLQFPDVPHTAVVLCIGYKALVAAESIDSEPSRIVGEWMSPVLKPSTSESSYACLVLDLKPEEFARRIKVELIYQDVDDSEQKTLLFNYNTTTQETILGAFEFHLSNVLQYQVCG